MPGIWVRHYKLFPEARLFRRFLAESAEQHGEAVNRAAMPFIPILQVRTLRRREASGLAPDGGVSKWQSWFQELPGSFTPHRITHTPSPTTPGLSRAEPPATPEAGGRLGLSTHLCTENTPCPPQESKLVTIAPPRKGTEPTALGKQPTLPTGQYWHPWQ